MKYKYGDFCFKIIDRGFLTIKSISQEFSGNFTEPNATFDITKEELQQEHRLYNPDGFYSNGYIHSAYIYRKIAEWLPLHDAFVLHSACFDVCGEGVVFAAHSGTGKTTHMLLWQKLLGDKMTIVNGDKPIVRFFEDEPNVPYAYGTPWNGKERLGCNMRTPVKHICFIERSETNYVEKMQPSEIIDLIFNQVYMPKDPMAVVNTMQLINRFINCCSIWKIHCNMDISAAEVAYNTIFGNK